MYLGNSPDIPFLMPLSKSAPMNSKPCSLHYLFRKRFFSHPVKAQTLVHPEGDGLIKALRKNRIWRNAVKDEAETLHNDAGHNVAQEIYLKEDCLEELNGFQG